MKLKSRENERKVKAAVKRIHYRLPHQAIKAWDAYVVWIIEVKEPQCDHHTMLVETHQMENFSS